MNTTRPWLAAQGARLAQLPTLEDALLGERPLRYVTYRLRYLYLRALLRCCFRLLELALLSSILPFGVLGSVLLLRSAAQIADGLYWGALETLRRDVRELANDARLPQAVTHVRHWLAVACLSGLAALGSALLWLIARQWLTGSAANKGPDFIDLFVLGSAVRWALEALSRTYHAGIYGLRRVFRPLWSLLLVDLLDIVAFAVLVWQFGPWGLGLSIAFVGAIRTLLASWFTRRTYAQLKLNIGGPRLWFRALGRAGDFGSSLKTALGNLVAQVDALLIVGLLSAPGSGDGGLLLAALFHVVAPLQSAAVGWSRLFYFDFKRLEAWGSPFLLGRLDALLARVAWLAVLPVGAVTFSLMALLWRGPFALLAFELTCLGMVRSWLALRHMRAYAFGDHRFLAKLGAGMLAVTATTAALGDLEPELALGALVTIAALGVLLLGRPSRAMRAKDKQWLLGPSAWLNELLTHAGSVRLGLARVDRRLSSLGRITHTFGAALPNATLGRLTADTLIWFEKSPGATREALLAKGSGCLRELVLSELLPNGRSALLAGLPSPQWQRTFGTWLTSELVPAGPTELPQLHAQFTRLHGDLRVLEVNRVLPGSPTTASRELRKLVLDAARGRTGFQRVANHDVAVLCQAGTPLAWVFAPVTSPRSNTLWLTAATELLLRTEVALTWRANNSIAATGAQAPKQ